MLAHMILTANEDSKQVIYVNDNRTDKTKYHTKKQRTIRASMIYVNNKIQQSVWAHQSQACSHAIPFKYQQ